MRYLLTLTTLLLSCVAFSGIIYVDKDSPIPGSGTSWITAFHTMDEAYDAANLGDDIWVAEGVYAEDKGLQCGHEINVYCGFAGWETQLSQRDWENNQCIFVQALSGAFHNPIYVHHNPAASNVTHTIVDGAYFSNWGFVDEVNHIVRGAYHPLDMEIRNCSFFNMVISEFLATLFDSYYIGESSFIAWENCHFESITVGVEAVEEWNRGEYSFDKCSFDFCTLGEGTEDYFFKKTNFFNFISSQPIKTLEQ